MLSPLCGLLPASIARHDRSFTGPLLAIILVVRWKNTFQAVFVLTVVSGRC
jgi:hypothetical protein